MSQRPEDSDGNTRSATEVHRRPADRTIRIDEWSLAIIEGPGSGRSFRLPPGELTAGHSPENDIVLADRSVSRRHFTIQDSPEGHVVRDLGSKNGTLLDGVRVHEAYILAGGIITAGDTKLRLEAASQSFPVAPSASSHFGSIIGESPAMREMFTTLAKIAPTSLNVLMLGETGVGKEVVAQAIHEASPRRGGPLVVFDCSATEPSLIGPALFGQRRGAFTGATEDRKGAFLTASGGTLFIDELGELSLDLQPRLLRVLEKREVQAIGSDTAVKIDVRVVSATHRDIRQMVKKGQFRQDLYYRLAGLVLPIPTLRERPGDVLLLAEHFLAAAAGTSTLSTAARAKLAAHPWPGNVRELKGAIERAVALCGKDPIDPNHLQLDDFGEEIDAAVSTAPAPPAAASLSLDQLEREAIVKALLVTRWNRKEASRMLGITPKTLRERIARYGLTPPEPA